MAAVGGPHAGIGAQGSGGAQAMAEPDADAAGIGGGASVAREMVRRGSRRSGEGGGVVRAVRVRLSAEGRRSKEAIPNVRQVKKTGDRRNVFAYYFSTEKNPGNVPSVPRFVGFYCDTTP